jgi:hypothetical protein
MCGQNFTKTRATISTIMGDPRVQQTLTIYIHMRQLEVCGHETLFYPNCHPPILDLKQKLIHFFHFFYKAIMSIPWGSFI